MYVYGLSTETKLSRESELSIECELSIENETGSIVIYCIVLYSTIIYSAILIYIKLYSHIFSGLLNLPNFHI